MSSVGQCCKGVQSALTQSSCFLSTFDMPGRRCLAICLAVRLSRACPSAESRMYTEQPSSCIRAFCRNQGGAVRVSFRPANDQSATRASGDAAPQSCLAVACTHLSLNAHVLPGQARLHCHAILLGASRPLPLWRGLCGGGRSLFGLRAALGPCRRQPGLHRRRHLGPVGGGVQAQPATDLGSQLLQVIAAAAEPGGTMGERRPSACHPQSACAGCRWERLAKPLTGCTPGRGSCAGCCW